MNVHEPSSAGRAEDCPNRPVDKAEANLTATVAICTWNRAHLLAQTLEGLRALVIPPGVTWEVLIVDNNSTDETASVTARFESVLPIRSTVEVQQGLSHARNRALREGRGTYLLFTDDDVLVDPLWLSSAINTWHQFPEAAIVGGPIEPWFGQELDPEMARAFPLLANGYCGLDYELPARKLAPGQNVYGASFAVRAAGVQGLSFNTEFGTNAGRAINGEEVDLIRRVRERGGSVVWSPGMRVRHYVEPRRMTLPYVRRYYFDDARHYVRMHGLPGRRRIAGAPAWLWRQLAVTFARACALKVFGSRERWLMALRDYVVSRGMFVEARSRRPVMASDNLQHGA